MYGTIGRIHMVGIGGTGMNGIAEVLLNMGYEVSGSDRVRTPVTDRLVTLGARVAEGHRGDLVRGASVVVVSTAIGEDNPEIQEARALGIPVIARAEMLAELMRMKYGIAVAGAHGKTTTTSIVAAVLGRGGLDPTVVVGGRLKAMGTGGRLGSGEFIVAEADESDGSFLRLNPTISVITNIDREHLDHWRGGIREIRAAFVSFANKVPFYGVNIVCVDDPQVQAILPELNRRVVTYGMSPDAAYRVSGIEAHDDFSISFDVHERGFLLGRARIGTPGEHSARNALAAIAVGRELEIKPKVILEALAGFEGVARRFEIKGEEAGVLVVDDYGHHPNEIRAVLAAARAHSPRRRVVIFQPHRFTRTRDLLEEFGTAFREADLVFLTPVYPAGEDPIPGIDAEAVADRIRQAGNDVHLVESVEEAPAAVLRHLRGGDLVLTLGAGTVYRSGELLLGELGREGVTAS